MALRLTSNAFAEGGSIPPEYTCDGDDFSPPLAWDGVPAGAKSLALVVDDPDAPDPAAPKKVWVHWILYNLPAAAGSLPRGVAPADLPADARVGTNDSQTVSYRGPCPPIGRHRYFHKLYALDVVLPDLGAATKAELEKAMDGHVLEKTELVGTYERDPARRR